MTPAPAASATLATLPDDPVVLKRVLAELLEALRTSRREIEQLQNRLDQVLRRLYGPRAERFDPQQPLLFATPAVEPAAPPPPVAAGTDAAAPAGPRRSQHGRQRPPAHLPRDRRVYELTEAERRCPCCGAARVALGQETSAQFDYIPASLRVIEHVRLKYACPRCQQQHGVASAEAPAAPAESAAAAAPAEPSAATAPAAAPAAAPVAAPEWTDTSRLALVPAADATAATDNGWCSTFVTATRPAQGLPRCLAAAGLLAHVIVAKFVDHLPLYRLERQFTRQGVHLARQTLCDWLAQSAALLRPLWQVLSQQVLQSLVIQTDDTPVPVQDGSRDRTRQGRVWLYHGDLAHPGLVYQYSPNREQHWPQTFLQDYRGFLQADAYAGYDRLFATDWIVEVGCWAHARRKFFEAQTTDPERALYVLGVIRQLYAVEKRARQEQTRRRLPEAEYWTLRLRWRQQQSVPALTTLGHWLRAQQSQVLPKSPIGEAIGYALNQWEALLRYTTRGFLEIDNNAAERALRPIAIGRKNYLFFGSDVGGESAAVLYSFVQTCQHLSIEPWRYLRDVLERLPLHPAERLEELLPDRWAAAQRAATAASLTSPPPESS
jgi:transposase